MSALPILVAIAALTCSGFLIEALLYRRRLDQIPIRIHVNGTRGKSSVARLIVAGLRAGGIRTCGKTTGTLARMILSDGSEHPIFRPCRANVIEQKRVIRVATQERAEALVIECMALQPLLQSVCELKLVRSTIGVITNARADHLDVMGPTRLDVARALAGTTPVQGKLFTAEARPDSLEVLRDAAQDRSSQMESLSQFEVHRITPEVLARFSYLEHPENIALALRVCEEVGVDRDAAIDGMCAAKPDPGAMRVFRHSYRGKDWHFMNAFAANDPESTERIWDAGLDRYSGRRRRIAVMNCRVDRADRSRTMAQSCARWRDVDQFVVIGSGTDAFVRPLLSEGCAESKVVCLGDADPDDVVAAIADDNSQDTMILGIGNIAGPGMKLADFFEEIDASSVEDPQEAATVSFTHRLTVESPSSFAKAA